MKVFASGLASHYTGGTTRIATALLITRRRRLATGLFVDDGIYGFTTHFEDQDINGVTYVAYPGMEVKDVSIAEGLQVGNLELTALHDGTLFTIGDIKNRRWQNAEFLIFRYNSAAVGINSPPTTDIDEVLAGTFGEARILENTIVIELLDLREYMQQDVLRVSSETCRARFGDPYRCGVRIDPPQWAATTGYTVRPVGDARLGSVVKPSVLNNRHFRTITAGTSGATEPIWNTTIGATTADGSVVWRAFQANTVRGVVTSVSGTFPTQIFADTGRPEATRVFDDGELVWLTGDNALASQKIKLFVSGGEITMALPFAHAIQNGDEYEATVGCLKRILEDCQQAHDNELNFDGEPHRQGTNDVTSTPSSDVSAITAALEETFSL